MALLSSIETARPPVAALATALPMQPVDPNAGDRAHILRERRGHRRQIREDEAKIQELQKRVASSKAHLARSKSPPVERREEDDQIFVVPKSQEWVESRKMTEKTKRAFEDARSARHATRK